jgi:hypothetical protein
MSSELQRTPKYKLITKLRIRSNNTIENSPNEHTGPNNLLNIVETKGMFPHHGTQVTKENRNMWLLTCLG